jgi:hypothetical protein
MKTLNTVFLGQDMFSILTRPVRRSILLHTLAEMTNEFFGGSNRWTDWSDEYLLTCIHQTLPRAPSMDPTPGSWRARSEGGQAGGQLLESALRGLSESARRGLSQSALRGCPSGERARDDRATRSFPSRPAMTCPPGSLWLSAPPRGSRALAASLFSLDLLQAGP